MPLKIFREFIAGERCIKFASKLTLIGTAFVTLAACESFSGLDPFDGGSANYTLGAPVDFNLSGRDRDALGYAFTEAMASGKPQGWSGSRARGVVEPLSYALGNLKADPNQRIEAARGDLNLAQVVETELGLYVLTRNSNIRTGPNTSSSAVEVLNSGTGVDVVGRVRDRNWMLVAVNDVVRGYVFGDLLIKAPGSELELAGGPMRKPVLCRNFRQRINMYSDRVEWEGTACNDGTGWRIAPPPPPGENAPDELVEF
ncbi:SH3 domain-containing protein [Hyphococcus flavus]|uniref:SH3 domain-containing protein n=1 Tax=Hyphococcus flavus TaxID=1866326 RepID=A0AAE9ZCX1_9PROT|nr:SH3 domain-containing protein [Hyphococcus flavus]WDI32206.1 SH3 domain-containing protein [Hyphococcus flavus]